jgi:hypothetical protein
VQKNGLKRTVNKGILNIELVNKIRIRDKLIRDDFNLISCAGED